MSKLSQVKNQKKVSKGLAKAHKKEGGNVEVVTGLAESKLQVILRKGKVMSDKINENDALSKITTLAGIPTVVVVTNKDEVAQEEVEVAGTNEP